jgi:hypothetical protein
MENVLISGMYPRESKLDFIKLNLNIKVDDFAKFLIEHKEYFEQNEGWLNVDILASKKDPSKLYAKFTKRDKKEEVKAASHMPDRDRLVNTVDDDLPF